MLEVVVVLLITVEHQVQQLVEVALVQELLKVQMVLQILVVVEVVQEILLELEHLAVQA
jgi:hypothetical protein